MIFKMILEIKIIPKNQNGIFSMIPWKKWGAKIILKLEISFLA